MNRMFLKITNILLMITFTMLSISGLLQFFLSRYFYFEFHGTVGLILVLIAIVHIFLNRGWIKANIFGKKPVK